MIAIVFALTTLTSTATAAPGWEVPPPTDPPTQVIDEHTHPALFDRACKPQSFAFEAMPSTLHCQGWILPPDFLPSAAWQIEVVLPHREKQVGAYHTLAAELAANGRQLELELQKTRRNAAIQRVTTAITLGAVAVGSGAIGYGIGRLEPRN